jgi:hypothetical protein
MSQRAEPQQQSEPDSGGFGVPPERAADIKQTALGNQETPRALGVDGETRGGGLSPAGGFIVDDDAAELAPGQMRKSEFMAAVRKAVCSTADEALKSSGQTTEGCPYIEHWISYYADRDAVQVERAARKFAPETVLAQSASDYIPFVAARVHSSVDRWAHTGEVIGIPEEGAGKRGAQAGVFRKPGSSASPLSSTHPAAIARSLGPGSPLPSDTRSRMEHALGGRFDHVRIHDDLRAAGLAESLAARAFTVERHIAFAPGEFKPGTPAGDALLAHELAHVTQQQGPGTEAGESPAAERGADRAALGALGTLWAGMPKTRITQVSSGLRLQRCAAAKPKQVNDLLDIDLYNWNAASLTAILHKTGDDWVVKTIVTQGYRVYRFDQAYFKVRYPDGKEAEELHPKLHGASNHKQEKKVWLNNALRAEEAASTLFHEMKHRDIQIGSDVENEIMVRILTEGFRMRQGMKPSKPSYRNADGTVDTNAIRKDVEGNESYAHETTEILGVRYEGEEEVLGWSLPQ